MNINSTIFKNLSFPFDYLQEKQQLTTTIIYLFSISILILTVIMLLSFQIFYIL
jgi:hypothetical protein